MIELMVVLVIIALLAALLIPAIHQARETARRTQCLNNLKQMILGMHNYESTYQFFPPGIIRVRGSYPQYAALPTPFSVETVIQGQKTTTTIERWRVGLAGHSAPLCRTGSDDSRFQLAQVRHPRRRLPSTIVLDHSKRTILGNDGSTLCLSQHPQSASSTPGHECLKKLGLFNISGMHGRL